MQSSTLRIWSINIFRLGRLILIENIYIVVKRLKILDLCLTRLDLKYYQKNPHLIPSEWDGKIVYAFGGKLFVSKKTGTTYVVCLNCLNLTKQRNAGFVKTDTVLDVNGRDLISVEKPFKPKIELHSTCLIWRTGKDLVVYSKK